MQKMEQELRAGPPAAAAVDEQPVEEEDDDRTGLLIRTIAQSVEVLSAEYLEDLMKQCQDKPLEPAVKNEIRLEVQLQVTGV